MNKDKQHARDIIEAIGGSENILTLSHCMTRLRFDLKDPTKVNKTQLTHIPAVLGVVNDAELQVIVGPGAVNTLTEHINLLRQKNNHGTRDDDGLFTYDKKQHTSKLHRILKMISNIFIPLIPAFVGAGLIGGIAAVLNNMLVAGTISGDWIKQLVVVFNVIKDGIFAYLAIYTGINAAKVFGSTPGLGGVIGGTTLLTGLNDKITITNLFTGEPLKPGQGGIIGVIFAVWLLSLLEKRVRKIIPKSVDIILTPTISLLFIGLTTIFLIMPLAGYVSDALVTVVNGVIQIGGPISGFIIGASFLPLVMLGLHHVFTPVHIEMIQQTGVTYLLPIAAMAGAGQVGAAFALWFKCKRNDALRNRLKGALPVGILGIGEPLIYGVTLPLGRPFITACIGGGIGGAVIAGIGHIGAIAIGPSGVSLLPLIGDNKYLGYIIGLFSAYIGGFIITYFFGTTRAMRENKL